jgi:hypothetical protein
MNRDALQKLGKEDLIALVLAQADVIAKLTELSTALLEKRVAELEAKLGKPPKTPDNSSIPPSQGQKPNRAERRAAKRKGRPGVPGRWRNPDRSWRRGPRPARTAPTRSPPPISETSTPMTTSTCRRSARW